MTELLKQYYLIKKRFESDEVKAQYDSTRDWSVAYNIAADELLAKMNKSELTHVLEHTTGAMRTVVAEYIKRASETAAVKSGKNKRYRVDVSHEHKDAVTA